MADFYRKKAWEGDITVNYTTVLLSTPIKNISLATLWFSVCVCVCVCVGWLSLSKIFKCQVQSSTTSASRRTLHRLTHPPFRGWDRKLQISVKPAYNPRAQPLPVLLWMSLWDSYELPLSPNLEQVGFSYERHWVLSQINIPEGL